MAQAIREVRSLDRPTAAARFESVDIADLKLTNRFRGALSGEHARALAEFDGEYPPILVSSSDRVVIDGLHRVHAAKIQHKRVMCCEIFEGSEAEAFVEFVRRNVVHGLPLSLAERRAAARRILDEQPQWSDRRIGEISALSPGAVRRLRTSSEPRTGRHVGRDGRSRPDDPLAARRRIRAELVANPSASLRQIAARVGSSPETVRSVRQQLKDPESEVATLGPQHVASASELRDQRSRAVTRALLASAALTSRRELQPFVDLMTSTNVERGSLLALVDDVPLSKVYEVAEEARRRATCWTDFARALERRPVQRSGAKR